MYSPRIIERNIEATEAKLGIALKRYDYGFCQEARERLDDIRKEDGALKRELSKFELEFIRNEALMCKLDFQYFAERWATTEKDGAEGGGIGAIKLWPSQHIVLDAIARAEEEEYDKYDRKAPCDGILFLFNKARQEGLTQISRLMLMHRLLFYQNMRGISASVDEDKIKELYDRDKRIYNGGLEKEEYSRLRGMPWWLKPSLTYDVKGGHIDFNQMGSHLLYQFATQGSALGQGRQFDLFHGTELAYWPEDILNSLNLDLFPTFPQSPRTLVLLESVSYGRSGWWYNMSTEIDKGHVAGWRFCFIPWYVIPSKYRREAPVDWMPSDVTEAHAKMVYETSLKYTGRRHTLTREQLYWWESTRDRYRMNDELPDFLTNYCATPEEGHQHSAPTIVTIETMERIRNEALAKEPMPYMLRLNKTRTAMDDQWHQGKLWTKQIGDDALVPMHKSELDRDARGIVWIWEFPKRNENYIMGIDATEGIIPWSRGERSKEDHKTDNGCISILRKAREEGLPDVQVCEFAAPLDQESLALVANFLGRVYGGADEDGQALAVVEIHLSMGFIVMQKMMTLGYTNQFQWQHLDKMASQNTTSYGWYASPQAVRLLWERFKRALHMRYLRPQSQWFCEELSDCIWDKDKKTANAAYGKHDDRIRALAIAEWVSRAWDTAPDTVPTSDLQGKPTIEWQRRLISARDAENEMEEMFQSWGE